MARLSLTVGAMRPHSERADRQFPAHGPAAIQAEHLRVLRPPRNEETFAAAWAEGQALSFDAAFAPGLTAPDATADAGTRAP